MTSLRVLIVEDEPLIAMMLEDFIEVLGHAIVGPVDSAADGVTRVAAGGLDVAVLDVNLRDGPSWPVADALKAAGTPYIVATGGLVEPPPPAHADAPRLPKPYTLDGLKAALDRATAA